MHCIIQNNRQNKLNRFKTQFAEPLTRLRPVAPSLLSKPRTMHHRHSNPNLKQSAAKKSSKTAIKLKLKQIQNQNLFNI